MHLIFIPSLKVLNHSWIQIRFIKKLVPKFLNYPANFPFPPAVGRQISQYALYISVTQFTFYMVNSTFYTVNFLLFIWSTRHFI